jgi:L-amino acid N-acyltransferase YncA
MKLTVRNASDADASAIVDLINPLIATGRTAMKHPVTLARQQAFIRDIAVDGVCLVAVDEPGRIVGRQVVAPVTDQAGKGVGEISTFVAIDLHRRGVGRQLTEAMFGAARAKGCKRLRAVIAPDNPTALAFYYAMDFRRASGGWPQITLAERSTEVTVLTPEQAAICDILVTMRMSGIDEPAVIAGHGASALAAAKALLSDAIDAPVDWRHASMDDALLVLANLLGKRYPWLTVKARAGVVGAYTFTWK